MSVLTVLDHLLLRPLLSIYDWIFSELISTTQDFGFSIFLFSLIINVLLLPAYFQMERAGRIAAQKRSEVEHQVKRLKAHFKGRELYYYVRAVYRQYDYHPISAVLGATDLYVQMLVFATVYRYLSAHPDLVNTSFAMIDNLSQPDGLLYGVHLLPLLMTLINVLSTLAYVDDKRKRHQAFGLAALFLVLLYNSPSGLVLYWTANNFISLLRNAVVRFIAPYLPDKARLSWRHALALE